MNLKHIATSLILITLLFSQKVEKKLLTDLVEIVSTQRKVIALGENHQHEEFHSLIKELLADSAIQNSIDVIVVEFANSLYQNLLDRFINSERVDEDSLRMIWRNTLVSPNTVWDSSVYENFFRYVRRLNSGLEKKYRVIAGGAAIDWQRIQKRNDMSAFFKKSRSHYIFDALKSSVFGNKKRAIVIAGNVHTSKSSANYKSRNGYFYSDVSLGNLLELYYPETVYTVASIVSDNKEIKAKLKVRELYKVNDISNLNIEANVITKLRNYNGKKFEGFGRKTISSMADAVIYWGTEAQNTFIEEDKSVYQDEVYWQELNRRSLILRKKKMNAERRK